MLTMATLAVAEREMSERARTGEEAATGAVTETETGSLGTETGIETNGAAPEIGKEAGAERDTGGAGPGIGEGDLAVETGGGAGAAREDVAGLQGEGVEEEEEVPSLRSGPAEQTMSSTSEM